VRNDPTYTSCAVYFNGARMSVSPAGTTSVRCPRICLLGSRHRQPVRRVPTSVLDVNKACHANKTTRVGWSLERADVSVRAVMFGNRASTNDSFPDKSRRYRLKAAKKKTFSFTAPASGNKRRLQLFALDLEHPFRKKNKRCQHVRSARMACRK
jgi:hypothetical protein